MGKKIVVINGSHRGKKGYTEFLIETFLKGATEAGAICEEITLAEKNIKRCTGCFSCQREDRLRQCIFDGRDDMQQIMETLRSADALVFASPIYVFTVTSLFLNFLNRLPGSCDCFDFQISKAGLFFHDIDREAFSKPFVTILCQDNLEYETHKNAISYFKTFSRFMDAPYVGSIVRRSGAAAGGGRDVERAKKYPSLEAAYDAVLEAGREFATMGRVRRRTEKKANMPLINIPFFVKPLLKVKTLRKPIEKRIRAFVGEMR